MTDVKLALATEKDKRQLLDYLKHYKVRELIERRVDCYVSHNFTVVAKDKEKIVGILQWCVKEDPRAGVVEFEEVHVLEEYRDEGIGSSLVKYAIQSVRDYFNEIKIKPRKTFLFVSKDNKIARALYEKHGFKLVSELGNLFSDEKIDLLYSLDL